MRVHIQRSDPEAQSDFVIEVVSPMMVVDVLLAVQQQHDATLGFRYSCRVAMCGTCTLRVNGRSTLACQTPVPEDIEELWLGPLAGFPVVRDLIVDMEPFWRAWRSITPYLVPRDESSEPARIPSGADERQIIDPSLDCIACGACYSACGFSGADRSYLGPAALQRAMVLIADSRDGMRAERLKRVLDADGVDGCHYEYACTNACPKGLDPAGAIRKLRRWGLSGLPGDPKKEN